MYEESYSTSKFWDKISKIPKTANCTVIEKAITLYVILTEGDTPIWVKAAIVSCLGYLISPIDLYCDFLLGGYADDLAMMAVLLVELTVFVTPAIEQRVADYLPEMCN